MTRREYLSIAMTMPPDWLRAVIASGPHKYLPASRILLLRVALRRIRPGAS
jgi:hypothetical protein